MAASALAHFHAVIFLQWLASHQISEPHSPLRRDRKDVRHDANNKNLSLLAGDKSTFTFMNVIGLYSWVTAVQLLLVMALNVFMHIF